MGLCNTVQHFSRSVARGGGRRRVPFRSFSFLFLPFQGKPPLCLPGRSAAETRDPGRLWSAGKTTWAPARAAGGGTSGEARKGGGGDWGIVPLIPVFLLGGARPEWNTVQHFSRSVARTWARRSFPFLPFYGGARPEWNTLQHFSPSVARAVGRRRRRVRCATHRRQHPLHRLPGQAAEGGADPGSVGPMLVPRGGRLRHRCWGSGSRSGALRACPGSVC